MTTKATNRSTVRGRGPTRYRGITQHARKLGVTYSHLWRVLRGERRSAPLLKRYTKLLATMPHESRPYPTRTEDGR